MPVLQPPWSIPLVRSGCPTVGNLMALCEENYWALLQLIPDLRRIRGEERSVVDRDQDLFLEVLEQLPYTTLLRLTYYFDGTLNKPASVPETLLFHG